MKLGTQEYEGFFENSTTRESVPMQFAQSESDFEAELLRWAILAHPETVTDGEEEDDAAYVYELGEPLGNGMFELNVTRRDAGGQTETARIAAGLMCAPPREPQRLVSFQPTWLLSEHVHLEPGSEHEDWDYKPAFGRLHFGDSTELPHRRLFLQPV